MPIWGARLARFEELVGSVREGLGDEDFAAGWAEGERLGFDGALDIAFSVVRPTRG